MFSAPRTRSISRPARKYTLIDGLCDTPALHGGHSVHNIYIASGVRAGLATIFWECAEFTGFIV